MQFIFPVIAIIGIAIAVLAALRKAPFFNFLGILIAIYGGLKSLAFVMPPLPGQVIVMFMILSFFAFLIYFSIEDETLRAFLEPMRAVLADDDKKIQRILIVYLLIPLLAAYLTYTRVKPAFEPPVSARITHPEPPSEIEIKGNTIRILGLENPLRKETSNLPKFIEEGKVIYYENCFFCHGDDLEGKGNFSQAFNPIGAVIAVLVGGVGLFQHFARRTSAHVSARSCSIFCSAASDMRVIHRDSRLERAAMLKRPARDTMTPGAATRGRRGANRRSV